MKYLLLTLLLLAGCTATRQAVSDYQMGKTTPLEEGELSPKESAEGLLAPVKAIPYGDQAYPVLVTLLGGLFTWNRGRKMRKLVKGEVSNPITGPLGSKTGIEFIVQNASNILTGIFDVGPSGSGLKRGWKVGVSTAIALFSTALLFPDVQRIILQPEVLASISGLSALLAGIEKSAQKVIPIKEDA